MSWAEVPANSAGPNYFLTRVRPSHSPDWAKSTVTRMDRVLLTRLGRHLVTRLGRHPVTRLGRLQWSGWASLPSFGWAGIQYLG